MEVEPTTSTSDQDSSSYPSTGRAWGLVVLLTIAYAISFVDRQIINLGHIHG